jgi:hypothetical protein
MAEIHRYRGDYRHLDFLHAEPACASCHPTTPSPSSHADECCGRIAQHDIDDFVFPLPESCAIAEDLLILARFAIVTTWRMFGGHTKHPNERVLSENT